MLVLASQLAPGFRSGLVFPSVSGLDFSFPQLRVLPLLKLPRLPQEFPWSCRLRRKRCRLPVSGFSQHPLLSVLRVLRMLRHLHSRSRELP